MFLEHVQLLAQHLPADTKEIQGSLAEVGNRKGCKSNRSLECCTLQQLIQAVCHISWSSSPFLPTAVRVQCHIPYEICSGKSGISTDIASKTSASVFQLSFNHYSIFIYISTGGSTVRPLGVAFPQGCSHSPSQSQKNGKSAESAYTC